MMFFFFFKQKTAYEMRISDWSSDVCSSDLRCAGARSGRCRDRHGHRRRCRDRERRLHPGQGRSRRDREGTAAVARHDAQYPAEPLLRNDLQYRWRAGRSRAALSRSEEHTSELQSLMRISYAVFCLKKKTKHHNRDNEYSSTIIRE